MSGPGRALPHRPIAASRRSAISRNRTRVQTSDLLWVHVSCDRNLSVVCDAIQSEPWSTSQRTTPGPAAPTGRQTSSDTRRALDQKPGFSAPATYRRGAEPPEVLGMQSPHTTRADLLIAIAYPHQAPIPIAILQVPQRRGDAATTRSTPARSRNVRTSRSAVGGNEAAMSCRTGAAWSWPTSTTRWPAGATSGRRRMAR